MTLKTVVIVGKPNVGKSQLFNRLTGEKHSIVYGEPGITRDRISLEVEWFGKKFLLIDTGGYTQEELSFQDEINKQTEIALKEANLVLFMISSKDGIDHEDVYISKVLKKKKIQNVFLTDNKCDAKETESFESYKLGFGEALPISAEHGINTGILLEEIIKRLSIDEGTKRNDDDRYKITIIGRPNVGKSSLVNALLKEERVITSDIAGTTRDAIDLDFNYLNKKYKLIDTPGIRRHASIYKNETDKFSILRSKKSLERANMVWLVLDASEDLCELDERIGGMIYKANIPSIIIANKCDLFGQNTDEERRKFTNKIKSKFKFLNWSPIVFISAKEGKKLGDIFKKINLINEEVEKKVPRYLLHEFMHKLSFLYSVPLVKGKKIKFFSMLQKEGQVPTFLFLCNNPEYLHFSYARLVERQIRNCFGYKICPITVIYKKK